eukprot:GGOE01002923.1.p1 GENE.GGOE01002923.1~~GGOE01002923.1.p1  ORF type:complete len:747 (+),score=205.87 GGOE01002923.1:75-2315(+)
MGECIAATEEIVEATRGEAIQCRSAAFQQYYGLGPPDLCVLEKECNGWLSHDYESSYHWVAGVELVNAAAACSYLHCLLRHQEKASWLSAKYTFKKGVLCCWNPFSRIDCRVEMEIPGGVQEFGVQEGGAKVAMTPQLWEETFLASVLRSMDRLPPVAPLKVLRPLLTIHGEKQALLICQRRFEAGVLLGCSSGSPSVTNNQLVDVLKRFFLGSSRFGDFAEFLAPRLAEHPDLVSLVIEMEMAKKNWSAAWELLHSALRRQPDSAALLGCHARLLFRHPLPDHSFALLPDNTSAGPPTHPSGRHRQLAPGPQNLTSKLPQPATVQAKVLTRRPSSASEAQHIEAPEGTMTNGCPGSPTAQQHSGSNAGGDDARPRRTAQCRLQAERAIALAPEDLRHHLLLAEVLLEEGLHGEALRRLNGIPIPSLLGSGGPVVPEEDRELLILFGISSVAGVPVSGPETRRTGPERGGDLLWNDEGSDTELDEDEEEEECDMALRRLEGHDLRGVPFAVYQLLVRINAALGWEGLLALRSQVFHMEDEPQAGPNKEVAARWFDALFHLLCEDLRQMTRWKVEDEEAVLMNTQAGETPAHAEMVFDVHDRSAADWYHRGKLALRLLKTRSAVQAFSMSGFKRVNAPAYFRLLEVYAQHGALQEALLVVGHLVKLLFPHRGEDEGSDHSAGCLSTDKDILHPPVHPIVRRALFSLVAQCGLNAVRSQCAALWETAPRCLAEVLTDAVQLRVHGCDA